MARLIDADALLANQPEDCYRTSDWINAAPTVDAIPVEWMKAQIRPYTGDVSDIGKSARNGTIKDLIRMWQKEQEAKE